MKPSTLIISAICAFAVIAPSAAANAPLSGLWSLGQGATVEFDQTGTNQFTGTIRVNGSVACPGNLGGVRVTGSGTHYTGSSRFYLQGSCELFGTGTVDIALSDDGLAGQYVGAPPPAASCCTSTEQMVRQSTATEPDLPALVNSILVGLQGRYQQLVHTRGSSRRKSRLRALGAAGRSGRLRVAAYRAGPEEAKLKSCAVSALSKVEAGARIKTERAGRGLTALSNCLRSFADALPNGKPGTAAPPVARPGGAVLDGRYVGQNSTGTHAGNFSFEARGSYVGNFAFSMWFPSRCNAGRGDAFLPFSTPQRRSVDAGGRFSYTLISSELRIDIAGLVSGGRASGTVSVADLQNPSCSSGSVRWSAARL